MTSFSMSSPVDCRYPCIITDGVSFELPIDALSFRSPIISVCAFKCKVLVVESKVYHSSVYSLRLVTGVSFLVSKKTIIETEMA